MSNCVEFHTHIASIMEVLANAAVAEICKLVDDGYTEFRLEMSHNQKENRTLKRKLQMMELRFARERAERTMRERILNCRSGGGDGHFSGRDRGAVKVGHRVWRGEQPITLEVEDDPPTQWRGEQPITLEVEDDPPTQEVVIIEEERPDTDLSGKQPYDRLRLTRERTVDAVSDRGKRISRVDTSEPESESVNQRLQHAGSEHAAQRLSRCLTGENSRTLPSGRGSGIMSGRSCSFSAERKADDPSICPETKPAPAAGGSPGYSGSPERLDVKSVVLVTDTVPVKVEEYVSLSSWNKVTDTGSGQPQCIDFLGHTSFTSPDINVASSHSHALTNNASVSKMVPTDTNGHVPYDQIFTVSEMAEEHSLKSEPTELSPLHSVPNEMEAEGDSVWKIDASLEMGHTQPGRIIESRETEERQGYAASFSSGADAQATASGTVAAFGEGAPSMRALAPPNENTSPKKARKIYRRYLCLVCSKSLESPKKLEIHQRIHTGERPFACADCGKTFNQPYNLRVHQRIHTGERPYACTLCRLDFTHMASLKRHNRLVHASTDQASAHVH